MTLADLEQREIAQRRKLIHLIRTEYLQSTSASRLAMKICREDLRDMRSEIRKLRKAI